MTRTICIYHANCADGFTAAWVVRNEIGDGGDVEFVPASYGDAPPDVAGAHVVVVDFSYPRETLFRMSGEARSVLVLDHHKTAQNDLAELPEPHEDFWKNKDAYDAGESDPVAIFDMDRSGAQIAWDFFNPGSPPPPLVDYVADRDLWRWRLSDSRPINAVIQSWLNTFRAWDQLADRLRDDVSQGFVAAEGIAVLRAEQKLVDNIIASTARPMIIAGRWINVANCPGALASVVAGELAQDHDFGACYQDTPAGRVFSLRSRGDDAADVSEIAKIYGGGGHRNAAGFTARRGWEGGE